MLNLSSPLLASLPHPLPLVVMDENVINEVSDYLKQQKASQLTIICDEHTKGVLGDAIHAALQKIFEVDIINLGESVAPEESVVQLICNSASKSNIILAVGSGTINDLCKLAAHRLQVPYIVLPTAPSMNGYTSANASIIVGGHKTSLPASMPKAIFCDINVLARAPLRLIRAGLGDSLARPTAQADWLLSHLLLDTPYDPRPFALVEPYETELFDNAAALVRGDKRAIALLMQVLLLSGVGMTLAGGSYPASQGEHMIASHYEHTHGANGTYHGEQIGVTALTMARLQEKIIANDTPPSLRDGQNNDALATRWPEIRAAIRGVMLPAARIEAVLNAAGSPATPEGLGWDAAKYKQIVEEARHTRDRFTFLDIA